MTIAISGYEKHIGKLKKVDLSKYDNNTEKFFEEQYRNLVTDLSEEKIMDIVEIEVFGNTYSLISIMTLTWKLSSML